MTAGSARGAETPRRASGAITSGQRDPSARRLTAPDRWRTHRLLRCGARLLWREPCVPQQPHNRALPPTRLNRRARTQRVPEQPVPPRPEPHTTPASRLKLKPVTSDVSPQPHDRTEALQSRMLHGMAHRVPDCARPLAKREASVGAAAVNKSPVVAGAQLPSAAIARSEQPGYRKHLPVAAGTSSWVSGATPKRADKN